MLGYAFPLGRELAGVVFESFLTSPQLSPSGPSTESKEDLKVKAAGLTKAIAGHLQLQLVLIDAATQEPQLWRYTSYTFISSFLSR